jgi:hypothetical protein
MARIPGLRDFDVMPRAGGLMAIVPAPESVAPSVTALVDWQSAVPLTAAALP